MFELRTLLVLFRYFIYGFVLVGLGLFFLIKQRKKPKKGLIIPLLILSIGVLVLSFSYYRKYQLEHKTALYSKKNLKLVDFDFYIPEYSPEGARFQSIGLPKFEYSTSTAYLDIYYDDYKGYEITEQKAPKRQECVNTPPYKGYKCKSLGLTKFGTKLFEKSDGYNVDVLTVIDKTLINLRKDGSNIMNEEILKVFNSMIKTLPNKVEFKNTSELSF